MWHAPNTLVEGYGGHPDEGPGRLPPALEGPGPSRKDQKHQELQCQQPADAQGDVAQDGQVSGEGCPGPGGQEEKDDRGAGAVTRQQET
jgi:hypothetical protein